MRTMLTRDELIEYGVIDNKWLVIGVFTLLHYLATMTCVMYSLGAIARFDTGGPATLSERIGSVGAQILMFPHYQVLEFFHLLGLRFSIIFFVANDLLWAVCFYGLLRLILRRRVKARNR